MTHDYNNQPELFCTETQSRFEAYHAANPRVYELFKRFTFEKIRQGARNLGAKAVFERIRWETGIQTSPDDYKINNIYTPYYARLFMKDFPQHAGLFRLRVSKADDVITV